MVFLDKHLAGKLHVWLGRKVLVSSNADWPCENSRVRSVLNLKFLFSPKDDVHKV